MTYEVKDKDGRIFQLGWDPVKKVLFAEHRIEQTANTDNNIQEGVVAIQEFNKKLVDAGITLETGTGLLLLQEMVKPR